MPAKNTYLNFENHHKKLPLPFVAYADFECLTKPMNTWEPDWNSSCTMEYQKHEPCGFCLYIKPLDNIDIEIEPNPSGYTKKRDDEDNKSICLKKKTKKKSHKRLTIIFIKIQKDDIVKSAVSSLGNTGHTHEIQQA